MASRASVVLLSTFPDAALMIAASTSIAALFNSTVFLFARILSGPRLVRNLLRDHRNAPRGSSASAQSKSHSSLRERGCVLDSKYPNKPRVFFDAGSSTGWPLNATRICPKSSALKGDEGEFSSLIDKFPLSSNAGSHDRLPTCSHQQAIKPALNPHIGART